MFTTIKCVDGRADAPTGWQIKTGFDSCETYSIGDIIPEKVKHINVNIPGEQHLCDDVYQGYPEKGDYPSVWIVIVGGRILDAFPRDEERTYAVLYNMWNIQPPSVDLWTDAQWAEVGKKAYRTRYHDIRMSGVQAGMNPWEWCAHAASAYVQAQLGKTKASALKVKERDTRDAWLLAMRYAIHGKEDPNAVLDREVADYTARQPENAEFFQLIARGIQVDLIHVSKLPMRKITVEHTDQAPDPAKLSDLLFDEVSKHQPAKKENLRLSLMEQVVEDIVKATGILTVRSSLKHLLGRNIINECMHSDGLLHLAELEAKTVFYPWNEMSKEYGEPRAGKRAFSFLEDMNKKKGGLWVLHTSEQHSAWCREVGQHKEYLKNKKDLYG